MLSNALGFGFTDEQNELRRVVRSFFESKADEAQVRRHMESPLGYDPLLWAQMADELGLAGLAIPEEFGGQGFTFVELGVVAEELGRALVPSPYFASAVLASSALLGSGDDAAQRRYLPGIASGATIASLAVTEESGRWEAGAIQARARETADGDLFDADGWYHTKDAGYLDDDGFLYFAGRTDDMIKTSGANVAPVEVESVIGGVDGIRIAYVVGVPDPDKGALVCAVVVLNQGRRTSPDELAAACRKGLAAYKIPKRWVILPDADRLPYTTTNKIDKPRLVQLLTSGELA